jgi:hypothetical protein
MLFSLPARLVNQLAIFLSYTSGIPPDLPSTLVPPIKTYVSVSDITLFSQVLIILAHLLELSPMNTFLEIERDLLADIYDIAQSLLVSKVALDSILAFFAALVQADRQFATHIVPTFDEHGRCGEGKCRKRRQVYCTGHQEPA